MLKTTLILLVAAAASHVASATGATGTCSAGCEVVYLVVPHDGAVGERVVRDTQGRCWRDTYLEEATDDPAIKSMRPVSQRIQVPCRKV